MITREPEWDDNARSWELAWTEYLGNLCDCGAQIDEAHDPESVWLVDHVVCQRCRALAIVQRDRADEDAKAEKNHQKVYPSARKWTADRVHPNQR